jgi:hypothetical protein
MRTFSHNSPWNAGYRVPGDIRQRNYGVVLQGQAPAEAGSYADREQQVIKVSAFEAPPDVQTVIQTIERNFLAHIHLVL